MKTPIILFTLLLMLLSGCKTEKNYITNNTGPKDWQPPMLTWTALPDAEVRGTAGLDVTVTDSSDIPLVRLFVDGAQRDSLNTTPYRFSLNTDSLSDGVHLCEARAADKFGNLGISPVLRVNVMNSVAQGPRLIWVPDSFATIQAAINASTDYDTVRVRDGTYYETLNTFGKGTWIESEHGPQYCTVNGRWSSSAIFVPGGQRTVTIRGFAITAADYGLGLGDGALVDFFNNWVLVSDSLSYSTGIISGSSGGHIRNNLLSGEHDGVQLAYFWGEFSNNIVQNMGSYGLYNAATLYNPLAHSFNCFWQNGQNYAGFHPDSGEFDADPMIDLLDGRLLAGSPCIDAGEPNTSDLDGTRSDIGPFGGPLGYR